MNPKQLLTLATVSFLSLSIASGFTVTSPAFKQGATIPTRFTCDGRDRAFRSLSARRPLARRASRFWVGTTMRRPV